MPSSRTVGRGSLQRRARSVDDGLEVVPVSDADLQHGGLEVACGGVQVLGHGVDGEVGFPRQSSVADRLVLVRRVQSGRVAQREHAPTVAVQLGCVVELTSRSRTGFRRPP